MLTAEVPKLKPKRRSAVHESSVKDYFLAASRTLTSILRMTSWSFSSSRYGKMTVDGGGVGEAAIVVVEEFVKYVMVESVGSIPVQRIPLRLCPCRRTSRRPLTRWCRTRAVTYQYWFDLDPHSALSTGANDCSRSELSYSILKSLACGEKMRRKGTMEWCAKL
jgi:hypothetical protein